MRAIAAATASLLLAAMTGCGKDDQASPSPSSVMARCGGGRSVTVRDAVHDGVISKYNGLSTPPRVRVLGAAPAWVDVRRIKIAVGHGMLCVSAEMAAPEPTGKERVLNLYLGPPRDGGLARLGFDSGAEWAPYGAIEGQPIAQAVTTRQGARIAQVAVPIVTADTRSQPGTEAGATIDPATFTWAFESSGRAPGRKTYVDCVPGRRSLLSFPTMKQVSMPASDNSQSAVCR